VGNPVLYVVRVSRFWLSQQTFQQIRLRFSVSVSSDQPAACSRPAGCLFRGNPGKMGTLALKCSQLPSPLPRTDARIVISAENWV
jgi:hypothetical protein